MIIFLHLHLYMTSDEHNILSVFSVGRQAGMSLIHWGIKLFSLFFENSKIYYGNLLWLHYLDRHKVLWYHLLETASILSVFNVYFTFLNKKCRYRSFLDLSKILCPYVWISECFDGLSHTVGTPLPACKATSLGQRKKKLCQT